MLRPLIALAVVSLCAPLLRAQSSLVVEPDQAIGFDSRIAITSTQSIMGQEATMVLDARGLAELTPRKITDDRIDWSVGFPSLAMHFEGPMLAGGPKDTTLAVAAAPMLTDRAGVVQGAPDVATSDAQINMLLQHGLGTAWWPQFFSPVLGAPREIGETWETSSEDSTGDATTSIVRTAVTRYTLEAIVDTMGRRAMRVHVTMPTLTVSGTLSAQGMPMTITGGGESDAMYYYDAESGMLLAGAVDSEMNMSLALTGGAKMVIPVTLVSRQSIARASETGR